MELYRCYGGTLGALLYVGITNDWQRRQAEHAATKHWWPDVELVVCRSFPDRAAARAAELEAIRTEMPVHNGDSIWAHRELWDMDL